MITKIFSDRIGVGLRHFLNLHGRILACSDEEVLIDLDIPVEILMTRIADQFGDNCTVTMDPRREKTTV